MMNFDLARLAAFACLGLSVVTTAQEKAAPPAEAFGEAWKQGAEHLVYEPLLGKWNFVARIEPSPDAPASESKGTAEYKWLLGGRYLMEEVKLDLGGQIFEWIGIYGYDTIQKKYTAVWIDNGGTETEIGSGHYNPSTRKIDFTGDQFDPRTGGRSKFRWVVCIESKDKMIVEMYEPGPGGTEKKMLEIVGTR